jgi:hypothetical protein
MEIRSMQQTRRAVLAFGLTAALLASVHGAGAQASSVTAIDIALEPDAAVEARAHQANAALLKADPKGYALDATHRAHVTMLQRYVRTADLPKVYAAASAVMTKEDVAHWRLTTVKYVALPAAKGIGALILVVKATPDLIRLQQEIIDAVAPYTVKTGTIAAFYTTPQEPDIVPWMIDYVADYVPKSSGAKFTPHVTTGVSTLAFVESVAAKPFDPTTFSPVGASVYQIGNYGTARKELKALPFSH